MEEITSVTTLLLAIPVFFCFVFYLHSPSPSMALPAFFWASLFAAVFNIEMRASLCGRISIVSVVVFVLWFLKAQAYVYSIAATAG